MLARSFIELVQSFITVQARRIFISDVIDRPVQSISEQPGCAKQTGVANFWRRLIPDFYTKMAASKH